MVGLYLPVLNSVVSIVVKAITAIVFPSQNIGFTLINQVVNPIVIYDLSNIS